MTDGEAETLFELARSRVTETHIRDFSPADPGYKDYVKLWTRIYQTGAIPSTPEFEHTEVINLTGWSNPDDYDEPEQFRRFRRFTTSVAVLLTLKGNHLEDIRVANYLARDLIVDLDQNDRQQLAAVKRVLSLLRCYSMQEQLDAEYPFFTLALMILANRQGDDVETERLAAQLIQDESSVRKNDQMNWGIENPRFLFGLTVYDQLNDEWLAMVSQMTVRRMSEEVQLVLESLLQNPA